MSVRICQLSTVHPISDPRIYYKESGSLSKFGFDVYLVIPEDKDYVGLNNVKIRAIPKFKARLKRAFGGTLNAYKRIREIKPDIVHFHDSELLFLGIFLKILGYKIIYDVHEDLPKQILDKKWLGPKIIRKIVSELMKFFERFCASIFDGIVAATPDISKRFQASKTVTVCNFPISAMINSVGKIETQEDKIIVIYAGGLHKLRGIAELINAVSLLPDHIELWLLGKFESQEFESYCQSLPGWSKTKYLGYQPLEKVYQIINSADIGINVLYPIDRYLVALPTKAFEYMALSKPLVINRGEFIESVFEDAALYSDCDPEQLASAILKLAENKNLREELGKKGKKLFESKYSWESQSEKLTSFYSKILNLHA